MNAPERVSSRGSMHIATDLERLSGLLGFSGASPRGGRVGLLASSVGLVLSTAACFNPEPREDPTRFFILSAGEDREKAPQERRGLWRVHFRSVDVPPYLADPPMVVREGEREVVLAEYHRWAEPLEAGVFRVLRERLEATRPVKTEPFSDRESDDFEVSVRVVSCEGARRSGSGAIIFAADWEIVPLSEGSERAGGRYTFRREPWDGSDFDALAVGLSEAVRGLGDAIAGALPRAPRSADAETGETSTP